MKRYIKPGLTVTFIELWQMVALSAGVDNNSTNDMEGDAIQRRGFWGNLWSDGEDE